MRHQLHIRCFEPPAGFVGNEHRTATTAAAAAAAAAATTTTTTTCHRNSGTRALRCRKHRRVRAKVQLVHTRDGGRGPVSLAVILEQGGGARIHVTRSEQGTQSVSVTRVHCVVRRSVGRAAGSGQAAGRGRNAPAMSSGFTDRPSVQPPTLPPTLPPPPPPPPPCNHHHRCRRVGTCSCSSSFCCRKSRSMGTCVSTMKCLNIARKGRKYCLLSPPGRGRTEKHHAESTDRFER